MQSNVDTPQEPGTETGKQPAPALSGLISHLSKQDGDVNLTLQPLEEQSVAQFFETHRESLGNVLREAASGGPIVEAEVRALMNLAQTGMFMNALGGSEPAFAHHQGAYKALASFLRGAGKKAVAFNASKGGYPAQAGFKGAWSPLPDGFENLSLVEVGQHLRAHDIEFPLDPVTNDQVDAVIQLKNHASTIVKDDDEHALRRAGACNGSRQDHEASDLAVIVQEGGAA